ncbi:hypothetical protein BDV93DRAFT_612291 [Ceratobasidium sp. AG-I]|nr:hypothetical protein BDV93DRAFT_612291 [Ceratobasidium sp. AG-I]
MSYRRQILGGVIPETGHLIVWAWHDELVKVGNLHKALISWYFSLAHEIAHNLVQPHNAEYEYYFSSLAEVHMPGFSALLSQS